MAQQPPSKKPATAKPTGNQNGTAAHKKSQEDNFFDEFFQNQQPHQLDETPAPDQQRQWISDQLMWETTLGMREDDAINRAIAPVGEDTPHSAHNQQGRSAPKKPLSEQDRQMLRTQVLDTEGSPVVQAKTPPSAQQSPSRNPTVERRPAPVKPPHTSTQPVPRQSGQLSNTVSSRAPVSRVPPRPNTVSTAGSVQPIKSGTPEKPGSKTNLAGPGRGIGNKQGLSPTHPVQPKTATYSANKASAGATQKRSPSHSQTQPVAIKPGKDAAISLDSPVAPHILDEERREQFFRWAKMIAGAVSIAITSFIGGYHFGGKHADEVQMAHFLESLNKVNSKASEPKPTHESKTSKSAEIKTRHKPESNLAESNSIPTKNATSDDAANLPAAESRWANSTPVFEGKDIPLSAQQSSDGEGIGNPPASMAHDAKANEVDVGVKNSDTEDSTTNFNLQTSNASSPPDQPPEQPKTNLTQASSPQISQNEIQDWLNQSLTAFKNKQWQPLVDLSNKILALDPKKVNALTNRAAAYTELNQFGLAIKDCNSVIEIDPKNALAFNNRGYVYEKMGDIQNAITDYQAACSLGIQLSCKEATRLKQGAP